MRNQNSNSSKINSTNSTNQTLGGEPMTNNTNNNVLTVSKWAVLSVSAEVIYSPLNSKPSLVKIGGDLTTNGYRKYGITSKDNQTAVKEGSLKDAMVAAQKLVCNYIAFGVDENGEILDNVMVNTYYKADFGAGKNLFSIGAEIVDAYDEVRLALPVVSSDAKPGLFDGNGKFFVWRKSNPKNKYQPDANENGYIPPFDGLFYNLSSIGQYQLFTTANTVEYRYDWMSRFAQGLKGLFNVSEYVAKLPKADGTKKVVSIASDEAKILDDMIIARDAGKLHEYHSEKNAIREENFKNQGAVSVAKSNGVWVEPATNKDGSVAAKQQKPELTKIMVDGREIDFRNVSGVFTVVHGRNVINVRTELNGKNPNDWKQIQAYAIRNRQLITYTGM